MEKRLIIIGSGPGGYVAAIRAAQLGFTVQLIEKENLGGICLNWGCIPTKALLKSAEVLEYLLAAETYGFKISEPQIDFPKIIARSRAVADKMSRGVEFLMRKNKIEVIKGTARLLPGPKVEVTLPDQSRKLLEAPHIILATGGRPANLPHIQIDGKLVIGYREAMTLPKQPTSLLVIGAGAIGVEFSYFFHTLGTKVTLVEALPHILPREDEEVARELEKIYRKKGLSILTSTQVTELQKTKKGIKATLRTPKETLQVEAELALLAVGIVPNTDGIGLEELGVQMEKGRIIVDEYYRTNVPGLYAIGDILPTPALAHVASMEGIICVEKIAGLNPQPLDYSTVPSCTYAQPEVASMGLTEKAAREKGYDLRIGKFPYTASGKASAMGKNEGFVKLIFDAKYGELLGAHIIGPNATEMIGELVTARRLETTGHEIMKTIHPHPTLSEAIMEAAAAAYGEVIHL
ncbi:MAG: dihydrolipoyl dehydrogenase [Bacteroidia bacterium]|nr:dihydrolipoyl dehydrogenase [Bacteroidia bacterium]MCX7763776.1 dihydrolipoyl dehydrogenase [Bacteroidia bacterium]MDW8058204.1 dihydrolipoyl dehydrogenase [Bacteroidia bacterium]